MSREVQGFVAELREAVAEGMRQCLAVAGDIQESEGDGASEKVQAVKRELEKMVGLDREAGHMECAAQQVEATATTARTADDAPEDPPELLREMEVKLTELMAEDFDLGSHPRLMELAQLLTREAEMDETTQVDGDIHVEKIQVSLKCPLTGSYLEEPVSNSECGHVYSHSAVLEHIRHSRHGREARCPVCNGPLSASCLRPEPGLADRVRRARRKDGQHRTGLVTL